MRRIHLGALTLALPVLLASLLVVGCGKDSKSEGGGGGGGGGGGSGEGGGGKKRDLKAVVAKGGTVKGKITLKGSPDVATRNKNLKADMDKHQNKDVCEAGKSFEKEEFEYRIGDNKQVGNVFVWLIPGEKDEYFQLDEGQVADLKKHTVTIDQPHCAFIPHCAIYVPSYRNPKKPSEHIPTGQKILVKNSAPVSHNTKVSEFNQTIQAGKEEELTLKLRKDEYEMSCTIHPWMRGHVRTFDHPYATLSLSETTDPKADPKDGNFGTYEIKNTPVGKLRIVVWHESGAWGNKGGPDGEEITIKEGMPTEINFEIEGK